MNTRSLSSTWELVEEYLKPLRPLFDQEGVTEIMVNGHDQVFIEVRGEKRPVDLTFPSPKHLETAIIQIANASGQSCDLKDNPIVDARLQDGSRICGVLNSIAPQGHSLTIRLFPKRALTTTDLLELGSVNQDMLDFLELAVHLKRNILLSGSTGSGKTTFLNILTGFIDPEERIVTVEDTEEIRVTGTNHVSLITPHTRRSAHSQAVSLGLLIKTTLRMNPDRIIVGEIRDAEAAAAFLQAINTGHNGCASTIHANHPEDAMIRLQTLLSAVGIPLAFVEKQVRANIHLLVQVGKVPGIGRVVLSLAEVIHETVHVLWRYDGVTHRHVREAQGLASSPTLQLARQLGHSLGATASL